VRQQCLRLHVPLSPQAEFEVLFGEVGVTQSLDRLDNLLARQPQLPDGTRLCASQTWNPTFLLFSRTFPNGWSSRATALGPMLCRPLASLTEADHMIAAAALPTKRQYKAALEQAICQVRASPRQACGPSVAASQTLSLSCCRLVCFPCTHLKLKNEPCAVPVPVQIHEENKALQHDYDAAQPILRQAAAEIAACKELVEKVCSRT
jgi:hypothetical protein